MSVRYFEHVNFRPCIVRTSFVLSSAEDPRLQQLIRAQSTPQGLAQSGSRTVVDQHIIPIMMGAASIL
jgi:hypothetical protein